VVVLVVVPIFALLGYVVQRTLLQKSIDRDPFTTLLVTFGLSVVIENLLLEIYTANAQSINIGSLIAKSWQVNNTIYVSYLSLTVLIVSVVVLAALQLFLSKTSTGRQIRAVSDDREAAQLCGTNYRHIFGVASSLAFATVALAGSPLECTRAFRHRRGVNLLFAFETVVIGESVRCGERSSVESSWGSPNSSERTSTSSTRPGGQRLVLARLGDPPSGSLRQEGVMS